MANLKLIAIAIVVGVVAFLGLCVAVAEPEDPTYPPEDPPDVRYYLYAEQIDSYVDYIFDLPTYPEAGKKFVVATYIIANDHREKPISTNPYMLECMIEIDGITMGYSASESFFLDQKTVSIEKGAKHTLKYCWEIDKNVNIDDIIIKFNYDDYGPKTTYKWDSSLAVPVSPTNAGLRYDTWYEEIATSYDVVKDPVQPDEGMKFILMHFRFVNDNVEAGINLDPKYSVWKIVSNGVEYMQHWTTYTHPDRTSATTLYKGGQIDDIRVFQIPEGDDTDSVRFKIDIYGYGDPFKVQKDENLL